MNLFARTRIAGDDGASTGATLQSFGLMSRIENMTGDLNSFLVLDKGFAFLKYIRSAEEAASRRT